MATLNLFKSSKLKLPKVLKSRKMMFGRGPFVSVLPEYLTSLLIRRQNWYAPALGTIVSKYDGSCCCSP
jgi:hypothetical protein